MALHERAVLLGEFDNNSGAPSGRISIPKAAPAVKKSTLCNDRIFTGTAYIKLLLYQPGFNHKVILEGQEMHLKYNSSNFFMLNIDRPRTAS
jgi:hypothetical protein